VTILSVVAFAFSPLFIIFLGVFPFYFYPEAESPTLSKDPGTFLWFCFWLFLVSVCFLALAWASFKAGLELWRLTRQGLVAAVFTMTVFLLAGIIFLLIPGMGWKLAGAAVCTFGGFFLIYLCLPSIENRFTPAPSKPRV
jgi:hypothetical protein